jgi:peroxiredoxin
VRKSEIIFILIIFLFLGFLVFRIINRAEYIDKMKVLSKPFKFIDEGFYIDEEKRGLNRVVILFTTNDCSLCLFEARYWGLAYDKFRDKLVIIGITTGGKKVDDFASEYNLRFKIYRDTKLFEMVCRYIRQKRISCITPLKFFISNENKVIAIEGGIKNEAEQTLFAERVASVFGIH